ncbi:MAG: PAS domain S-box protein, partial [Candidatus Omnitrophica bacterium]|nr:PAS domain S-box protein [Candidatus Omnitrophota bacterium]
GLSWQADYHLRLRNGSERWLSNSAVQVRDREGKVIGSLGILQDITDRKMAEEAVRERERIYRSAIEVAGAAVYYQNYTTNFTYEFMGDQIETLTGFRKEEFSFDLWKSRTLETVLAGPLEGLTLEEAVQRARGMEGISWRADYRIRTKNGAEKWLANSAVQVRDRDGKVIGSLGILQDITERKVAEAAIRRSEQLYRNAIQAAGAVPYFRDKHTDRYEFLGDRIKELVGVSPEEFNGPRFDEIIQETILLENLRGLSIEDAVEKVERERDTRWRADYRIRRPDGEERWLSDAAVQVRDEKGEVIGSLGILTDTTDARRAEKELREALSRFEAIIENTPHVAIQGFDRNGLIRHWNSASETFYGHSAETALGQTIQDLLQMGDEREEFKRILAQIWDSGEPIPPREWTVRGREGEELCVYSTMFPIFSSGEVIEVFCMDVDITESKRAEEERRRLEAQIHHTQKLESLGVLAGGIAHDFNNLLMGVLGNASLALLELSPESPARESVAQIETAALRAADLAKQMLAYSGKGKFVVQRINLSKLVEEMSHLVEVSITKKAVLRYHFAENLPAIEADATQIRQVILNLITNASDALGTKSGIITVNTGVMEVDAEYLSSTYLDDELPPGHYVYIEVSDTGCGMDEETRAKIFDP